MSTGVPCDWCLLDVITVTCVKKREIQVPGRLRLLIIEACQHAGSSMICDYSAQMHKQGPRAVNMSRALEMVTTHCQTVLATLVRYWHE